MRKRISQAVPTIQPIPFTKEGYENLKKEQLELTLARKDAVQDLAKARAMGDLSENGYYKAAKLKLSSIDHRLTRLKFLIRYANVKEATKATTIDIGSTFVIDDGTLEKTFTLVGGYESNPSEGKISHVSPLGKVLVGKKVGDTVIVTSPRGKIHYTITTIK